MTTELWPVGTWVAYKPDGVAFLVTNISRGSLGKHAGMDLQEYGYDYSADWVTRKDHYTELPPLPDVEALKDQGYRLTGMAAKIGDYELKDGERSVTLQCEIAVLHHLASDEYDSWRWLVERIDTETVEPEKPQLYMASEINGNIEKTSCFGNHWKNVQKMPPMPDVPDGMELTWKAVKIDNTFRLQPGEKAYSTYWESWQNEITNRYEWGKMRWVARKIVKSTKPASPWSDASDRTPDTERTVFCRLIRIGGITDHHLARFRDQERWVWLGTLPVAGVARIQWMEIPE